MIRRHDAFFTACTILAVTQVAWGGERITKILLPETVGQWAVDEASGRIFASLPEADCVAECDPATGQVARKFSVPGEPTQLIVKSHWLVVGCAQNNSLGIIDLTTNKVAGSVPLGNRKLLCLFASKADNAYAYGCCGERFTGQKTISQIDCSKQTISTQCALIRVRAPSCTG